MEGSSLTDGLKLKIQFHAPPLLSVEELKENNKITEEQIAMLEEIHLTETKNVIDVTSLFPNGFHQSGDDFALDAMASARSARLSSDPLLSALGEITNEYYSMQQNAVLIDANSLDNMRLTENERWLITKEGKVKDNVTVINVAEVQDMLETAKLEEQAFLVDDGVIDQKKPEISQQA